MDADLKWLTDPAVFRVNRLDAHSDHICYANKTEITLGASSLRQSLDGQWGSLYDIFLCRTVDGKLRQLRNVKSLLVQIFFQAVGQEVFQMLLLWLVEDTYLHLIIALLKS